MLICHGHVHPGELCSATRHSAINRPPLRRLTATLLTQRRLTATLLPQRRLGATLLPQRRLTATLLPQRRSTATLLTQRRSTATLLPQRRLAATRPSPCRNCRDIILPRPDIVTPRLPPHRLPRPRSATISLAPPPLRRPQRSAAAPRTCGSQPESSWDTRGTTHKNDSAIEHQPPTAAESRQVLIQMLPFFTDITTKKTITLPKALPYF